MTDRMAHDFMKLMLILFEHVRMFKYQLPAFPAVRISFDNLIKKFCLVYDPACQNGIEIIAQPGKIPTDDVQQDVE